MTTAMLRGALMLMLLASTVRAGAQGLPVPATWKWITDAPSQHQTRLSPPDGQWLFGVMAPGWHITTRPGVVAYEPSYAGAGRFSLEAETFLFPGTSDSGLGLMLGGRGLDGAPSYTAFLIRRDGSAAVERRDGDRTTTLVAWTKAGAIVAGGGTEPARNVLRVDVEADVTRFLVNGTVVAEVPRPAAEFAGQVGLRIGRDIDVHVTNLDLTLRMALPRGASGRP